MASSVRWITLRLGASAVTAHKFLHKNGREPGTVGKLLAETGLDGNALASLGPAARQHLGSALGLHTASKSVRL